MIFLCAIMQFVLVWGRSRPSRTRRAIGFATCAAVVVLGLTKVFFDEPLLIWPISDRQHGALTSSAACLSIVAGFLSVWSVGWLPKLHQKEAAQNGR
jgi:hypothetical protein